MVFGLNGSQGLALVIALLVALALAIGYAVRLHAISRKRRVLTAAEPTQGAHASSPLSSDAPLDSTVNPLHRHHASEKSLPGKVWYQRTEHGDVWYDDGAGTLLWELPAGAVACNVETASTVNPLHHHHAAAGQRASPSRKVWCRKVEGDDVWFDDGEGTLVWNLPEGDTAVDATSSRP